MPTVFISYRRDDTADIAGRLYERLAGALGADSVFKDVHSIPGGAPFEEIIKEHLERADTLLVLIGSQWATIEDETGRRRITSDGDLVRAEVAAGLASSTRVIPVLTTGASLPDADDLPEDLAGLVSRNAMSLRRDPDFAVDVQRILTAIGYRRRRRWWAWASGLLGAALAVGVAVVMASRWSNEPPAPHDGLVQPPSASVPPAAVEGVPIVAYDPAFLGGGHQVPLPRLTGDALRDAHDDGKPVDYLHYSLVMNEQRSLATYVAINADRERMIRVERVARDIWLTDPRLPLAMQREGSLYRSNDWDRGHLVPRRLVTWEDAAVTDPTSFQRSVSFYSATAPQHANFNRSVWLGIEQHVLEGVAPHATKLVVFAGPVFRDSDPVYRDTRIPRTFWQVVVAVSARNRSLLEVYAFAADQYALDAATGRPMLDEDGAPVALPRGLRPIGDYTVTLSWISEITDLDFGYLEQYDVARR